MMMLRFAGTGRRCRRRSRIGSLSYNAQTEHCSQQEDEFCHNLFELRLILSWILGYRSVLWPHSLQPGEGEEVPKILAVLSTTHGTENQTESVCFQFLPSGVCSSSDRSVVFGKRELARPSIDMRVSIIVPTLNEEAHIEGTIRSLQQLSGEKEIIVVDRGSTDQTFRLSSAQNDWF